MRERMRLSEGLWPLSDGAARVSCAAQAIEQLSHHAQVQCDACRRHRRSKSRPASPNAVPHTCSHAPPVSGEQAHTRRSLVLAGVQGCSMNLSGCLDALEATRRGHTGALIASIEHPRFWPCSRSLALVSRPASSTSAHVRQAFAPAGWQSRSMVPAGRPNASVTSRRAQTGALLARIETPLMERFFRCLQPSAQVNWPGPLTDSRLPCSPTRPTPSVLPQGSTTAQWRRVRAAIGGVANPLRA